MSWFLTLAYLFFLGSLLGWGIEVFYRHFLSHANPEHKWINPGFCTGPYLPLYGSGLCILYVLAHAGEHLGLNSVGGKILTLVVMGIGMTVIEYLSGLFVLHFAHVRLWDYTHEWGNLQGLICPKFSFYWTVAAALYYFFVHSRILSALAWLANNLAFSFVIGFFFGVFVIDVCYNAHIVAELKAYAEEKQIIIRFEALKAQIKSNQERASEKVPFLFPFRTGHSIAEHLKESQEAWEKRISDARQRIKNHRKTK